MFHVISTFFFVHFSFEWFLLYLLCFTSFHCISAFLTLLCVLISYHAVSNHFYVISLHYYVFSLPCIHHFHVLCTIFSLLRLHTLIRIITCCVLRHFTAFLRFFSSLRSYFISALLESFLRLPARHFTAFLLFSLSLRSHFILRLHTLIVISLLYFLSALAHTYSNYVISLHFCVFSLLFVQFSLHFTAFLFILLFVLTFAHVVSLHFCVFSLLFVQFSLHFTAFLFILLFVLTFAHVVSLHFYIFSFFHFSVSRHFTAILRFFLFSAFIFQSPFVWMIFTFSLSSIFLFHVISLQFFVFSSSLRSYFNLRLFEWFLRLHVSFSISYHAF
jgi:hypothetical protein